MSLKCVQRADDSMCGIAGLYARSESPREGTLDRMNQCLVHRGPDQSGTYIDGSVGLANRRLSIVGVETGRQPIFNEDGTVAVVFNGEIYNYGRLRQRLQRQGHEFTTETDTEVLVHLYEERGDQFVEELNGMFAVALWDSSAERLLLARDQMGIKPLYLGVESGGRVAFASELSALFPAALDVGGLDRTAVAEYFAFGYIPAPNSAFQNVSKLRPGELAVVDGEGVRRAQFYEPEIDAVEQDRSAAAREVRARVETAVEDRLQAEVPLGAFLSGGIDSSIVTGILAELSDEPVQTFTVGFSESQFDERWAAREVASYHDTDHHEYEVSPADVREVIEQVIPNLGEPFADPSILPTYIVSQRTAQEMTVALSGDGADELFAGYSKYRGEYYSGYYRVIPERIRQSLIEPSVNRLPASRGTETGDRIRKGQKFVRGAGADIGERQYQWMATTTPQTAPVMGQSAIPDRAVDRIEQAQTEATSCLPDSRQDALARIQMTDARFALPDGILAKVDRASMQNSLEVRVPFLDTDVFEFAMGLPTGYKITPTEQKRILTEAFGDLLPETVQNRGKQGFDVPIGEWFKEELRPEFLGVIEETQTEVVDTDFVMDMYREHSAGTEDHAQFLWAVYVFLRWERRMREREIL
jgi:asparagine synthase (glutamine-hydrolysing)